MKIAIVGSRTFNDYYYFGDELLRRVSLSDMDVIISGGAKGVDKLAEDFAKANDIPFKEFKANWEKYGKGAGFIRNSLIVEKADMVIAFWDGKSTGTKDSIDKAIKKRKTLLLFFVE